MTADDPLRETDLEMALRHVIEAELRIARQRVLVERLAAAGGRTAELSQALLADFQMTLEAHRAHLARLMPPREG
ncbi:hypothetical protein VQ02_24455 [Methylobacterium variabile]|jgi:hypothetical protein|uniref:Uncharacterized protein n=1 Tax=Methylobacterium variabile TaxID=298794 RepID=A0A0J6SER1_9HYPH|nr:hypothetical protein [Methylobacterium variabile]KMO32144.1 hypothetical protein VQ02_24455 [Methylobacterium variabile]